jgi:hypothetical protein
LAQTFAKSLFKFDSDDTDPANIEIILEKALEKLIYLFQLKDLPNDCDRKTNFLLPK